MGGTYSIYLGRMAICLWQPTQDLGRTSHKIKRQRKMKAVLAFCFSVPDVLLLQNPLHRKMPRRTSMGCPVEEPQEFR